MNETIGKIEKKLSKQVDVWKICYVEKNKPSPTFLTVLDEMWVGRNFGGVSEIFLPLPRGDTEGV